jgi:small subunit ribosomal protein S18
MSDRDNQSQPPQQSGFGRAEGGPPRSRFGGGGQDGGPPRSRFGGSAQGPRGDADGGERPRGRRGGGRYVPRRKVCMFCVDRIDVVDYKDIARLRRHISERGKIEPRRKIGTCARHQRSLTVAIKRARHVALLPFVVGGMRG